MGFSVGQPRKQRTTLAYENVLEYIRARLLNGELKAGSQLPTVAALAAQMNVGPASVREAYRILQTRGILEMTQGRGTFVSANLVNLDEFLDKFQLTEHPSRIHLLEARKLLEPGIAELAAKRATAAECKRIMDIAYYPDTHDVSLDEWREVNINFHDSIAIAAHNPVISELMRAITELQRNSLPRVDYLLSGEKETAVSYHKLVAVAIGDGNAEAARTLMYQHIAGVEKRLLLAIQTEEQD